MSYSKQQISETADFIADRMFLESQEKLKAWFCRQFVANFKQYNQLSAVTFSAKDELFSELKSQLASKALIIPSGFKVTLFQNGSSLCYNNKDQEVIFPRKPVTHFKDKLNTLISDDFGPFYDEEVDEESEADFAPLPPQGPIVYSFAHLMPIQSSVGFNAEEEKEHLQSKATKSRFC
ncbi:hypothetical protein [Candidatus Berkiella aquae]|uniref:Uncharacterized protein n=1 Tax=Candidatus Berkiella aquae TaxID=295108 RepID=A0A0Q9YYY3_9GAMM|nr:hypothetical protein [Candidatus Berkiella aquae]MCS5711861.1 hypothetical protein [Candidatus Berkiella aquae]